MAIIEISDIDDPRLDDYRDIRDRELRGRAGFPGLFIGEQALVVERMLGRPGLTKSVLIGPGWVDRIAHLAPPEVPVYTAPIDLMRRIAGFNIHRGVLAVGHRAAVERPGLAEAISPAETLELFRSLRSGLRPHTRFLGDAADSIGRSAWTQTALTLLLCEDVTNIDNIGFLFRNAAAFGVDAVLLSPRCHDPLYRKSLRVSIGHALTVPFARSRDWQGDLESLSSAWDVTLIAAAAVEGAAPLDSVDPPRRVGIIVGQEYDGISPETLSRCDHVVRIPMAPGVDSLNVAVAAAVCLHRFSHGHRV